MKITCPVCGESTDIKKICLSCGSSIPELLLGKGKAAEDAFRELSEILLRLKRTNGSEIADIPGAKTLYNKAAEIKQLTNEFQGENQRGYDTLGVETEKLNVNILQAEQKAKEARLRAVAELAESGRKAEEARQREAAREKARDKKSAQAKLWGIYISSVVFSLVYFSVFAAIVWGIVTFLPFSTDSDEALKNALSIGFAVIVGLTAIVFTFIAFIGTVSTSGCLGRILGAIGGAIGAIFIAGAIRNDFGNVGIGWTLGGLVVGAIGGWLIFGIILGGGIGATAGFFLGRLILWLLIIPMVKIILLILVLAGAGILYVKIMSKGFSISSALLERCGKAGKSKYITRNALIAAATLLLAAGFYPQVSKAAEQVVETVQRRTAETAMAEAGFVRIQGGAFTMGSPASEANHNDEEVQHQVTVGPFYMGKYEVRQKEYQELMGNNPSEFKGDNLPVEKVSWLDAVKYCNERSQAEGLNLAYTIDGKNVTWDRNMNGYRLPTEAEWEYACRAGTNGPFGIGIISTAQANYDGNYSYNGGATGKFLEKTWSVGSGAANEWGLYDMHGNVKEWCWDWYGKYSGESQTDPEGPASGSKRVLRGGSWYNSAGFLRSAYRGGVEPTDVDSTYGFRLVRQ
ncbi:SUMF1/EgtB/PvdO family nonheme iron enzyme [Treponema primitia]|uniref:SUMF1/EgtB/PvdO family nonheme iron enzyme n=1 Tax=Treponema primitia TaxID=88058 RepID=UPI0039804C56